MIKSDEKIAVLMGGDSSEREISLRSGTAVLKALQAKGYDVAALDISEPDAFLSLARFDKAFIALHGAIGEDGTIQGLLETLRIPYTGSGVLASAATMDKAFAKKIVISEGIETPEFQSFNSLAGAKESDLKVDFPLIVKPAAEGSTIGISYVEKRDDLEEALREAFDYGDKVLIERFVKGREVTVSVLDGRPLPIVEVVPKSGFYDFEAKYTKGMTEYIVPAKLEAALAKRIADIAARIYNLFHCRGAARVDFIIEQGIPCFLEINTIPGMTETSLLPMSAGAAGIGFEELVVRIIEGAKLDQDEGGVSAEESSSRGEKKKVNAGF